jgi:DNA-binding PucR family transcriptional regulator
MTAEEIVVFAEGLSRVAASGGGAKALAAYLAERTQTGVLVEDAEWKRVTGAGSTQLPASSRDASATQTLPISAGSTTLGYLSIFAPNSKAPAHPEHVATLLRLTAAAIAVELAREHDGGRGRRRTFWERLVARAYHDPIAARDDAAARGITCASQYVAVVLEPDVTDEANAAAQVAELRAMATEAFRAGDADLGVLERAALLVLLVPATREVDAENVRTAATLLPKTLAKRKSTVRITGGVGSVEGLLSAARSVEHAEAALTISRTIYGPGHVSVYDDLGAYPLLLHGASADVLRAFSQRVLAPLRAYDEKHQTELERTLRLYFSTGQNVKTAAADLNVHRHTVFYRLRQIADISGRSLESAHDQLTLRLAIAIDALHTE